MNLARRTTTTSLHTRPALLLKREMQSSLQINRNANAQRALDTTLLKSLFRIDRLTNHLQVVLSFQGQAPHNFENDRFISHIHGFVPFPTILQIEFTLSHEISRIKNVNRGCCGGRMKKSVQATSAPKSTN